MEYNLNNLITLIREFDGDLELYNTLGKDLHALLVFCIKSNKTDIRYTHLLEGNNNNKKNILFEEI